MSENVMSGFLKALSSDAIRVVDLSQPLDAGTATIQMPPEFGKTWPFRLEEISKYGSRGPVRDGNNLPSIPFHAGRYFQGQAGISELLCALERICPESPSHRCQGNYAKLK